MDADEYARKRVFGEQLETSRLSDESSEELSKQASTAGRWTHRTGVLHSIDCSKNYLTSTFCFVARRRNSDEKWLVVLPTFYSFLQLIGFVL